MTDRTFSVGLTGGLASGKSTVASMLRQRGVPVLDADAVVHGLYGTGGEGVDLVADLFGDGVLKPDQSIDRAALAARVLGDPEALEQLNRAIHPVVRDEINRWLHAVEHPIAVVEAALLVETGSWKTYDLLMVVRCTHQQQLERAFNRGVSPLRARALLGAQAPIEEKTALANVVVDNSGGPEQLEAELNRAWAEVEKSCQLSA
ncbi:MAG: dephospho-CoA kinase [Acidobacteria bacterium]|nr:MAG: dephospho-CoA kinase [Acidobacteriota bacterium]